MYMVGGYLICIWLEVRYVYGWMLAMYRVGD